MTRWSAITPTRRSYSALAYGSRSTAAAEKTSTRSYTTSRDATRLYAIIKASAPALSPKTWYGIPAYAKDGKVVCFFQSAQKFKSRYRS
jgi:uncharacterized protein YdhG (YjbR/CyaY superfamily)